MISGNELSEFLALQRDNKRLERELNEALRALRKTTGCNWEATIKTRALPWVKRKTCEDCNGLGEHPVDKWAASMDVEPTRCATCKGEGEIYVVEPHDPDGPPCAGCPNSDCSDYELCCKKRL